MPSYTITRFHWPQERWPQVASIGVTIGVVSTSCAPFLLSRFGPERMLRVLALFPPLGLLVLCFGRKAVEPVVASIRSEVNNFE